MRDTKDMAREAGIDAWWDSGGDWRETFDEHLKAFEALVRADERDRAMRENAYVQAEREACAKVCEDLHPGLATKRAAELIRARGNT